MKISVPYFSQYLDVADLNIAPRACGFAVLKMLLHFYQKDSPDIAALFKKAVAEGGYNQNGLAHDYSVALLKSYGLKASRVEGLPQNDFSLISADLENGRPVIVSVEKKVLEQKRFHQVLLVGQEERAGVWGFWYHEPESLSKEEGVGPYRFVSQETFSLFWRGMAILAEEDSLKQ